MSGQDTGQVYDLTEVTEGGTGETSVPNGEALSEFCAAIIARDAGAIGRARARVTAELGEAGMADAAATIAAFNAYPRAADATGIPLEDAKAELTAPMRAQLGLDALAAADAG